MVFGKRNPEYEALLKKLHTKKLKRTVKPMYQHLTHEAIDELTEQFHKEGSIYIPYNVISSKNSRRLVTPKGRSHPISIPSKAYEKYKKLSGGYWLRSKVRFRNLIKGKPKPILLGVFFIRCTKGKFDYLNMGQGPADLMQEFGWIIDDDMKNIKIIPEGYIVDKQKQGMVITVLDNYEDANENRLQWE